MIKLDGIFPPIPTSFDLDENLAHDKLRSNLNRLTQFDLSGFLVLGSNGEKVMLSDAEKKQVFETAREAIPVDKLMLAGTGEQSTRATILLTNSAAECGADAALVLNPSYYKGLMSKAALVEHYQKVADASRIPIIIYNMPACSGLDLNAEIIIELAGHPNIIGIKDSGGNIVKLGSIVRATRPEFQVLAGSAGFLLAALAIGAVGGILALANIAPRQCLDIYRNYLKNDLEKARQVQLKMIPVNTAITSAGGVPALKAAMDHLGLYGGPSRKPILPVSESVKESLFRLLAENNVRL